MAALATLPVAVPAVAQQPRVVVADARASGLAPEDRLPEALEAIAREELQPLRGESIDGQQLAELLSRLTTRLQASGYPIAQAAITPDDLQTFIRSGVLTVRILPGRVARLETLDNSSGVATPRIERTARNALCPEGVGKGCLLTAAALERMELLLRDLPNVKLAPLQLDPQGVEPGETAVQLQVERAGKPFQAYVGADNYGYPSSGQYRFSAGAMLSNLLEMGDVIRADVSVSNKGAIAGAAEVSLPIGYDGLRGQVSYVRSQYSLPENNVEGSADNFSAGLTYPIVRGLDANWIAGLSASFVESRQTVIGLQAFPPRDLYNANLSLRRDSGDRALYVERGSWSAAAFATLGNVDQSLSAPDPSGVLGTYFKFKAIGSFKEFLGDSKFYLLGAARGQGASRNLDPYEKLPFGGQMGVRAYRADEGSFDAGAIVTLELRRQFTFDNGDVVAPGIALDAAGGLFNIAPYPNWQISQGYLDPTLANTRALAGIGPSIDFVSHKGFSLSLIWSFALPGSPNSINNPGSTNQVLGALGFRF